MLLLQLYASRILSLVCHFCVYFSGQPTPGIFADKAWKLRLRHMISYSFCRVFGCCFSLFPTNTLQLRMRVLIKAGVIVRKFFFWKLLFILMLVYRSWIFCFLVLLENYGNLKIIHFNKRILCAFCLDISCSAISCQNHNKFYFYVVEATSVSSP